MGALVAVSGGWAAYGIAVDATNESKSPLDRIRALELRVQVLEDRPAIMILPERPQPGGARPVPVEDRNNADGLPQ